MVNQQLLGRFRGSTHRDRFELNTVVGEVCQEYAQRFADQRIALDVDVSRDLWVHVDRTMLATALRKLVENALDAMPNGGELTVTGLMGRLGLEIEVADSGPAIRGAPLR